MKPSTSPQTEIGPAQGFLDHLFDSVPPHDITFRLCDGTFWPDPTARSATIVLNHPGALRSMFGPGTEIGLAEAYLAGDFDIEGDIETACGLAGRLENRPGGWRNALDDYLSYLRLPDSPEDRSGLRIFVHHHGQRHSLERDRAAVSFHYDLSNDFYGLWLDRDLLYSCAYFATPETDLETAQQAKLRYLCRKLRLQRGQRLLDLGCGWGGLAIHAAREHGVEVTGVTLSARQAELAARRARAAGVGDRVRIELRDYRELREPEAYDAIVSVGMAEHAGVGQLPGYFQCVVRLLRPGGVMLNHAIGEGVRPRRYHGPSFIDKYIFPDGHIPPIPEVLAAAEPAGFEVRDVENLREHYTLTLRQWVRRLEANHTAALAEVEESTYRAWRLYLAGSAYGFNHGHLAVYQVLLAKPDAAGRAHLPLTRRDWYLPP